MKESLIYGLFGGLIGSLYMGWICSPKPPSFAVIDLQALISFKAQQLAKTRVSDAPTVPAPTVPIPLIQEVSDRLKEALRTFATTHNFILLAKNAVLGGDLPDKTEEVLALMQEGEKL